MDIIKLASFTQGNIGGNPAGVAILDRMPSAQVMLDTAAEVGFSETAFAVRQGAGFRVRYFAPEGEVPFCGHATIALGSALGQAFGAGDYTLILNEAEISVTAAQEGGMWSATLTSPGTWYRAVEPGVLRDAMAVFGLAKGDLDPGIAPAIANGGALHLILPLARHQSVIDMRYDFDAGAAFMQAFGFVTVNLCHRAEAGLFHARNAFAGHGVYEDPATGAAAAALAGYLRDSGVLAAPFVVLQGVDMGVPSRLNVAALAGAGASVRISGTTRNLG